MTSQAPPQATAIQQLYYTRCPAPTATGVASALSLLAPPLAARGVALTALQDVADEQLRTRHFDHGIVELIREGGNIPAIWARSAGAPTRLLGITWLDEYQAVVTSPDSGIRGVADLAGRRLPVARGATPVVDVSAASSVRGIEQALRTAGLELSDVSLVEVDRVRRRIEWTGESYDAELELLAAGAVDAVWLKGAAGVRSVRERGLAEVLRIDQLTDPLRRVNNGTPRTITARQELIDEHPELVREFLDSARGAYAAVPGDGAARRAALWRALAGETHESESDAQIAYGEVTDDSLVPSLSAQRIAALQDQADFLHRHGYIPARVDVAEWALEI